MRDLLATYYAIQINEEIIVDGKTGFRNEEYLYFTIIATNNKAIHMEQTTLAYYLAENGYHQTAFPIPNMNGEWMTNYQGNNYLVVRVGALQKDVRYAHGKLLARFHQINSAYHYEPQYISSYGQWKKLWIDKCTEFEDKIITEAKENKNDYYRLLMDVLPYIIGISENAIQYMQESEREYRYDQSDQGTISFQRYQDHLLRPVIWQADLVYDHLTRDLAEFIREKFLAPDKQVLEDVLLFLNDYQSVHPLTVFSWRLLYARLIFPIHMYDCIERAFFTKDFEKHFHELTDLLERQSNYERNLHYLFQGTELNHKDFRIPVLQWL